MPRRLIVILTAAAVLIVGAIAVVWFVNRSPSLQNTVERIANLNTNSSAAANTNTVPITTDPVAADVVAREYTARNFAESFGSGTSQDNFSNWEKTKPFTTKSFGDFLDRTRNQQRQATLAGPYRAYLTTALVVATTATTATTASMTIGTQRQDTIEAETTTYYQDLLLNLVKVGDEWKVNAASWSPVSP